MKRSGGGNRRTSMALHGAYFCKENANYARYYWQLYFINTKLTAMPVHVLLYLSFMAVWQIRFNGLMSFCTDLFPVTDHDLQCAL